MHATISAVSMSESQTVESKSKAVDSKLVVLERAFELVLGRKTLVLVLDAVSLIEVGIGIVVTSETADVDEVDPSLDAPV